MIKAQKEITKAAGKIEESNPEVFNNINKDSASIDNAIKTPGISEQGIKDKLSGMGHGDLADQIISSVKSGQYDIGIVKDLLKQKSGIPVLTEEDAKLITDTMEAAAKFPEGSTARNDAIDKVRAFIEGKIVDKANTGRISLLNDGKPEQLISLNEFLSRKTGNAKQVEEFIKANNLNLKYKKGYYIEHTTGPVKKITKLNGASGGHNYNEFKKYFDSSSNKYELASSVKNKHPDIDGIYDIGYKIKYEKVDYTGKNGTGEYKVLPKGDKMYKKTVYDPSVISNDEIVDLSKKAMEEGIQNGRLIQLQKQNKIRIQGQSYYNGKVLKFEGYMDLKTGEVENAWPVLEWEAD